MSWNKENIFLFVLVLIFSACGSGYPYGSANLSGESDYDYELDATGVPGSDMKSVTVSGRVSGPDISSVKVKITQKSTDSSKKVSPKTNGSFSATFESGGDSREDFSITLIDPDGGRLSKTEEVEVDFTGEWEGALTVTGRDESCEGVPIVSALDTSVTVEQEGTDFAVYLGGYLDLYPIHVTVEENGALSGSGSLSIPSSLASFVGCYSKVKYTFSGKVDASADPPAFDVDFNATLSGAAPGCRTVPDEDCSLEGVLSGEKL